LNANVEPYVEMKSITKRFLGVTANKSVDFVVRRGEIVALLGENGAGKSTLMNILFGYYTCDEGECYIKGMKVNLTCPKDAIRSGIGMIHQHFTLVPSLTVLENIVVGTEVGRGPFLNFKTAREKLRKISDKFGVGVDLDARVWTLSAGEQQRTEIIKALYREADILIMDEPTSVLAPAETRELFHTLKILVQEGRSVVFISHHLDEVFEVADRVVVLRDGEVVAERRTEETTPRELANIMVGREMLEELEKKRSSPGAVVLEIENLNALNDKEMPALNNVNINVRRHEIVGIAGVSGNGQTELSEILFGLRAQTSGSIRVNGKRLQPGRPLSAMELGLARIPEDRMGTGILLDLTVEENLVLEKHGKPPFNSGGLINQKEIRRFADSAMEEFDIKSAGPTALAKTLSGGNLQKVMIARGLSGQASVIVAHKPTWGIDIGAAEYIHQRMLEEAEKGAAILLISEDLNEIYLLSDRIVVLFEGRVMGEAPNHAQYREDIAMWMSGVRDV